MTRWLAVRIIAAWVFGVRRRLNWMHEKHGREVVAVNAKNAQLLRTSQELADDLAIARGFIAKHGLIEQFRAEYPIPSQRPGTRA